MPRFLPAPKLEPTADDQILGRAREFYEMMQQRQSHRSLAAALFQRG